MAGRADEAVEETLKQVLSRIALSEGNVTYVESSNLPSSGYEVRLTLDTPVLITWRSRVSSGLM